MCSRIVRLPRWNAQSTLAFARTWHSVSAKDRVLGPLAVNIATLLMGKHKPIYDQSKDLGDYVVVTDAKSVVVTVARRINAFTDTTRCSQVD